MNEIDDFVKRLQCIIDDKIALTTEKRAEYSTMIEDVESTAEKDWYRTRAYELNAKLSAYWDMKKTINDLFKARVDECKWCGNACQLCARKHTCGQRMFGGML